MPLFRKCPALLEDYADAVDAFMLWVTHGCIHVTHRASGFLSIDTFNCLYSNRAFAPKTKRISHVRVKPF